MSMESVQRVDYNVPFRDNINSVSFKSVIECGIPSSSRDGSTSSEDRVVRVFSNFFNSEVDVFLAQNDERRQFLFRSSDVARYINIRPSRLSMYLSRSDKRGTGIFQATDFLFKAVHSRLKLGTYFVTEEVCNDIKHHFAHIKKRQIRRYDSERSALDAVVHAEYEKISGTCPILVEEIPSPSHDVLLRSKSLSPSQAVYHNPASSPARIKRRTSPLYSFDTSQVTNTRGLRRGSGTSSIEQPPVSVISSQDRRYSGDAYSNSTLMSVMEYCPAPFTDVAGAMMTDSVNPKPLEPHRGIMPTGWNYHVPDPRMVNTIYEYKGEDAMSAYPNMVVYPGYPAPPSAYPVPYPSNQYADPSSTFVHTSVNGASAYGRPRMPVPVYLPDHRSLHPIPYGGYSVPSPYMVPQYYPMSAPMIVQSFNAPVVLSSTAPVVEGLPQDQVTSDIPRIHSPTSTRNRIDPSVLPATSPAVQSLGTLSGPTEPA